MTDIAETRQTELKNKKICRFCLTQNAQELSNIYSRENRMKTAPLPLQVMACVSIEVFSSDGMPSYVCNDCRLIFDYCYRFKQMCKKSDTCLRHYPLTGIWSPPMDKPKIPAELAPKPTPKNLNALQASKAYFAETIEEVIFEEEKIEPEVLTIITTDNQVMLARQNKKSTPIEIDFEEEAVVDTEYKPKKTPVPPPKQNDKPSVIKILNKSAFRILNKEAEDLSEPIMSKPIMKRDDEGNISIVTQILERDVNSSTDPADTPVLETNVFPCSYCERSFPLQQLLDIHMVNHNRERSFFCKFCDKSFFSKYDLQKHNLTHTGEKPYVCVVCQKGFTRSTLLHRHEKTHIDIPKYICVFCEKPFISQAEMEKHTERHRKHRPFVCRVCKKAFAFKQGLERHEVTHFIQQPFQCHYCDQSFSTPSKLSRHLTAHAGKRPYPCKLCPKSYLLSHHLTRHMRSHKNGKGSYKCNDCQKKFTTRDDLIYHSAVHATQSMVCPLCKDAFDDIESVTEHVKQHAEGEAYACEFCDFIFMTSDRLDEHIKNDHATEMLAYDDDDNKTITAGADEGQTAEEKITFEIEDVIEEYLYEPDDASREKRRANAIVKEENEWENQLVDDKETSFNKSKESQEMEKLDDETLELMNLMEMSEAEYEPPAKVKKTNEKSRELTSKVQSKQTLLRRKSPTKPANSSSSSPKENKNPSQKTSPATVLPKFINLKPTIAPPKTRQPTIQDALKSIPKSVSVKKVETANKVVKTAPASVLKPAAVPEATNEKKSSPNKAVKAAVPSLLKSAPETETTPVKKSSPKASPLTKQETTKTSKQSPNTNTRTRSLRQRAETNPETKSSPVSEEIKKKLLTKPQESVVDKKTKEPVENKNLVEMMIGNKKVKVKKITMTKAKVAQMTRDGLIQMKDGAMILKKSETTGKDV